MSRDCCNACHEHWAQPNQCCLTHRFEFGKAGTLKFIREGRQNVVVLRTFSKIQGLASLRIGYGIATGEMIEVLQKTRQPFNANAIAQAGALAGLEDDEHQRKTRELTFEGRAFLQSEFKKMGLQFVPSHANFVESNFPWEALPPISGSIATPRPIMAISVPSRAPP